jgi:PKHD-type hydroxylase
MISDYLTFGASFEDVIEKDPSKESTSEFWNLQSHYRERLSIEEDFFSPDELNNILVLGKRLDFTPGFAYGDSEAKGFRKSLVSWLPVNKHTEWIYRRLTDLVCRHNELYYRLDIDKLERLQFALYDSKEGARFKPHTDSMSWDLPYNRKLTFVLQLSEPDEYEGGDLNLLLSAIPTKIPKKKGLITFFFSDTLHEVTPVTSGERCTLVGWVHGPSFK